MNPRIEQLLDASLHKLEADGRPIPHNGLQKLASTTLRKWIPAPYQAPWMEWEYGTWIGSFACYDEIGRQLGEANVLPKWMATPLPDTWNPFKGPGIRQGHPYNVTAMHEMLDCWGDLLLDAATLRALYCRLHHRDGPLSANDLFIITTVAVSIPVFMLRRGDRPVADGTLPRRAAAAFKVIGGMFAACNRMLSQAHPMLSQTGLNVDGFLQYLEDERLLMSPESRACAAPVKMIQQIIGAAINPNPLLPVQEGLPHLGADAERAFAYGSLCARIDLGILLYWRSLKHYLQPLYDHPDTPDAMRMALAEEPELGLAENTPLSAYGLMAEHILAGFGETGAELEFMAALPLNSADSSGLSPQQRAKHCYDLELAMRKFVGKHQASLDQILHRPALQLPELAWSPAPCSRFLQGLFKTDARWVLPE